MSSRAPLIIALEPDRLAAVAGEATDRSISVGAWLDVSRPESVDPGDADAVGGWVREELASAGIDAKRAAFAAPRSGVVLKRLRFPLPEDGSTDELASMVRLQMSRQLTVPSEDTVVDFVELASRDAGTVEVLAGALPASRVEFVRRVARAAGLKLAGITLRTAGAAALLRDHVAARAGATLGVAIGRASAEFLVLDGVTMVHSRQADFPVESHAYRRREDDEALAEQIVVEAKRTWMTQRVAGDFDAIERVAVLGDGELARLVARRCEEELDLPAETVPPPRGIELPEPSGDARFATLAPLIGVMSEPPERLLDFASPAQAPDRAAQRRRRGLLVAAMVVVLAAFGWLGSDRALDGLKSDLSEAQDAESEARERYADYLVDDARASHLDAWLDAEPDWLAHIEAVNAQLPARGEALLDSIEGALGRADVVYTPSRRGTLLPDDSWDINRRVLLPVAGSVHQREVATALRARLIEAGQYSVTSGSADTPDRFDLDLATDAAAPAIEEQPERTPPAEDGT